MTRAILLPNGKSVTLGAYARAWRKVAKLPAEAIVHGWDYVPTTAGEVLRAMRDGLDERINRHSPHYGKGRKWADDWYWETVRLARMVNTPRLRVYVGQCPKELRGRLAHRLSNSLED